MEASVLCGLKLPQLGSVASWLPSQFPSSNLTPRTSLISAAIPPPISGGDEKGIIGPPIATTRLDLKFMAEKMRKTPQPPRLHFGEEVMRLIAGASSAPIAQYIPSPLTDLHALDPRVKQVLLILSLYTCVSMDVTYVVL